jgi:hypothetical protein
MAGPARELAEGIESRGIDRVAVTAGAAAAEAGAAAAPAAAAAGTAASP